MSGMECPSCGARLTASAAHAGADAGCPRCGALVTVPGLAAPAPRPPGDPPGDRDDGAPPLPAAAAVAVAGRDPSPAAGGDVPAPRASGAGADVQIPLALAAASLICPPLGPIAWWLVQRVAQPIRARGEEEPAAVRHARLLAMTGTALLVLVVVCCAPTVLVIG